MCSEDFTVKKTLAKIVFSSVVSPRFENRLDDRRVCGQPPRKSRFSHFAIIHIQIGEWTGDQRMENVSVLKKKKKKGAET